MKKTILSVCIVAIAGAANAQIGAELGLNISNEKFTETGGPSTSSMVGARIGAIYDIRMSDHFYLQPGVFYAMNGSKESSMGIDAKITINTIEVPINVLYKFGEEGSGFFVGAGPYIGYNLGGKQTADGFPDQTIHVGSDKDKDELKALDLGIGVNVGYELPMGLLFRARYQTGFVNMATDTDNGRSIISSSYGVSVAYIFGKGRNR